MKRREFAIRITVNGQKINKVVIDPHYEAKHSDSISDTVILELVRLLDGDFFEPDDVDPPYAYFVADNLVLGGKRYKLIWLLADSELYVGVVNAYRR